MKSHILILVGLAIILGFQIVIAQDFQDSSAPETAIQTTHKGTSACPAMVLLGMDFSV